MSAMLELSGECACGQLGYTVKGTPLMNVLCHCRNCSRGRGVSPLHLVAFPKDNVVIVKGHDVLKVVKPLKDAKLTHTLCSNCGCAIYQNPEGAAFRAVFPVTFKLETPDPSTGCGVSCKLPSHLMPQAHVNYENRLMDWHDDLPKFEAFDSSPKLNNDGSKKVAGTVQVVATKTAFDSIVASGTTLVDFTAAWCGPCQVIGPKFVELAKSGKFSNITFIKVDVDENAETSEHCNISCMPTFQVWKDGEKVDEFSGASESKLNALCIKHM